MSNEKVKGLVEKMLIEMTEHFPDCHVQVLMTFNSDGLTKSVSSGVGNWYARQGLAHEFINSDIAQENARQIADAISPPSDTGEAWKENK